MFMFSVKAPIDTSLIISRDTSFVLRPFAS